jgi:hypothetical protein
MKGWVYFNLLVASVLFVQSGALLVSQWFYKLFFNCPMLSQPAALQVLSTTLAAPHREL